MRRELGGLASLTLGLALLVAGCGGVGGVELSKLPVQKDFRECDGFTMNDDVATVDGPRGELRLLVARPEVSPLHLVPLRFDARAHTLVVSSEARAPVPGGGWGVGCLASGPGEPGRGYALLVARDGAAAILRIDSDSGESQDGRAPAELEPLASIGTGSVRRPSGRHVLELQCSAGRGGATHLQASVDGGRNLVARDPEGIGPFVAALTMLLTDRQGTDVRFDNLAVRDGR